MAAKPWPPNWREASQYPDWDSLTPAQKAWEFLRRNPGYQATYAKYTVELKGNPSSGSEADPPGEWVQFFADRFGVPPCDPAEPIPEDFEPLQCVELSNWETPAAKQRPNHYPTILGCEDSFERNLDPIVGDMLDIASEGGVAKALVFDLERPFGPQLERAKAILKDEAEALAISQRPSSQRQRDTLYVRYLRILDAETAGATLTKMAEVLFPHEGRTYAEGCSAQNKLRDNLKSAREFRDGGYMLFLKR